MEEYIVKRTVWGNVKIALGILGVDLLLSFYFLPESWFSDLSTLFYVGKTLTIIISPLLIYLTVIYIKNINNTKPYLIIREDGLIQNIYKFQSGLIRWEDINDIRVIGIQKGHYIIQISLKNPGKHITNQMIVKKMETRKAKNIKHCDIAIHTLFFKHEGKQVADMILQKWEAQREAEQDF